MGHFIVAKLCNVKVNKFAIGFGPQIFNKTKGETEYSIRVIPFGGFCQLEGEEDSSDDERALCNKNTWQKIAIFAAGATVNILFALIVYFFIALSANEYISTTFNITDDNYLYEAGINSGDKLIKVNGKSVLTGSKVDEIINSLKSDKVILTIEKNISVSEDVKNIVDIEINIPQKEVKYFGVAVNEKKEVAYVIKNSPAEKAGLKIGDKIKNIDGEEFETSEEIIKKIKNHLEKIIDIDVIRGEEIISLSGEAKLKIEKDFRPGFNVITPEFPQNLLYAADEMIYFLTATVKGTAEALTGKAENVEVMGPVGIAKEISATDAFIDFFYLMAAISLSLGIFNLIPIPALDGGRILIVIIEAIMRKPMNEELEQSLILAGFVLIMLLALVVTALDVIKLF